MATLMKCVFGPRLYRIYKFGHLEGHLYERNTLEKYGDQVIQSISVIWSMGVYTSPVLLPVLYRKGYFCAAGAIQLVKFMTVVGIMLLGSLWVRGIGRYTNPEYITFLGVLESATKSLDKTTKKALLQYDMEFHTWPAEFRWHDVEGDDSKPRLYIERPPTKSSALDLIRTVPCQIISYGLTHTIGKRMIYPGSVGILQYAMSTLLVQGRAKYIEEHQGERFKLITRDGNDIDTMLIDRRNSKFSYGDTLVICCEGNAGFYEVGIMVTPIEAGYSVLGWNHPGFGGSTGVPLPDQETNAVDAVMQFAIHKLNFSPQNIILFGWSIGAFPATWAAMNYPEVKAVILDATFDDILPMAISRMPKSWAPLVRRTIRDYMNLDNFEQIAKYPGPVLFIRRTKDEILTTVELDISTNRGNDLLLKFLRYRYPKIIDSAAEELLRDWLTGDRTQQTQLWSLHQVDEDFCMSILLSYISEHSNSYPMNVGEDFDLQTKLQMALFLAHKYMIDFESNHCTPLPASFFKLPWEISLESEYVKV